MRSIENSVRKDALWLENVLETPLKNVDFPTHFQVAVKLKNALKDPRVDVRQIVEIATSDPMTAAKLVQHANTAKFYKGKKVSDVGTAITRIGTSSVKRIAVAVALVQLTKSKEVLEFHALTRNIWLHSLQTAATSFVVASEYRGCNPYEAEFAGLVSNLGAYYLLYRAAHYEPVACDIDKVRSILSHHTEEMTVKVLNHLDMPIEIIDAVETSHLQGSPVTRIPRSMREIVYIGQNMADVKHPWREDGPRDQEVGSIFMDLEEQIELRGTETRQEYDI